MLGKVKQWLGIEGVKLEIVVPDDFNPRQGSLSGYVRLRSLSPQTVSAIKIVVIEKYSRGREEGQLVDEYELGRRVLEQTVEVPGEGDPVEIPFYLRFTPNPSPVDEFGDRNPLFGGLAWVARRLRNARSEFRVEAEAQVTGVGLNPFDRRILGA